MATKTQCLVGNIAELEQELYGKVYSVRLATLDRVQYGLIQGDLNSPLMHEVILFNYKNGETLYSEVSRLGLHNGLPVHDLISEGSPRGARHNEHYSGIAQRVLREGREIL